MWLQDLLVDESLQAPTSKSNTTFPVFAGRPAAQRLEFTRRVPLGAELDATSPTTRAEPALVQFCICVLTPDRQHRQISRLGPAVYRLGTRCGHVNLFRFRLIRAVLYHYMSRLQLTVPTQRIRVLVVARLADEAVVDA